MLYKGWRQISFIGIVLNKKDTAMHTNGLTSGFAMVRPKLPRPSLPSWVVSSVWSGTFLMLVAFGLLWAFHQVASDSVQQSEMRLKTISAFNQATWRCNNLNNQRARESCLAQRPALASATSP